MGERLELCAGPRIGIFFREQRSICSSFVNYSVLVEWNHILFDAFLPRAWAALLKVLLQDDHLEDVFRAWPPRQSEVFGGDNAYWQPLPAKLLACIVASKAEVWPVIVGSPKGGPLPHFAELGSVLVASADVDDVTLRALANAGLRITQLPTYIVELLVSSEVADIRYTLLSPSVAYLALSVSLHSFRSVVSPF